MGILRKLRRRVKQVFAAPSERLPADTDILVGDNLVTQAQLAAALGKTVPEIQEYLRELQAGGLVQIRPQGNNTVALSLKHRADLSDSMPLDPELLARRDLTDEAKLVLCLLRFRQGSNEFCQVTQRQIAGDLGMSVRAVKRALRELQAGGWVQIRPQGNNRADEYFYSVT